MLTILIGTDWKANRDRIMQMICTDVENGCGGRVLLVPELVSHDTERRLAKQAGDTASRFAEVLSFTRLARRVTEYLGCGVPECLDNGGRVVAVAAAIKNVTSRLKAFASVLSRPEFLTGLVEAMDEFKRCCITPEDLRLAAGQSEGAFAQKLEELALIFEAYDAVTAQGKRDPRDQMTWLLEQMEASDFAQNHVFYIDGFPDFTRQHLAVLQHLILDCPSVTVSVTCDAPGSKAMAYEKAGKTAQALISFARDQGVDVQIVPVAPAHTALQDMCHHLYQGSTEPVASLQQKLFVYRAESVHQECLCAAERILELVRQGCRYRDIGVVCADMGGVEDTLSMVFARCNIPMYRSGKDDVLQKNVIHSLLSALNTALGGFEQQDMFSFMRSVLSGLDADTCDLVENYAILWGIDRGRWTKPWENHPEGLSGQWDEESRQLLERLNSARSVLVDPLVQLRDAFSQEPPLSQQIKALCDFFAHIHLPERLDRLASEMDSMQDNRSAQILAQLWEIILSALEQMNDMLGDTLWEAESFTRLFTLLLSQYDVGTIPTVLDSVMVGPVNAMRCHQVKHLIVLSVREGALPGYTGSVGILTDREREQLRSLSVPLTGGGMDGLQSEFAEIYSVFCSAEETVTVSCGAEQPSFLYSRLAAMVGGDVSFVPSAGKTLATPEDAAALFVNQNDASGADALGIGVAFSALSDRANHSIGTVQPEHISALYGKKLRLSASQVDKQADCRFSYFLRYGLRAKELKEASVDPAEFGTYFHAVLEQTARKVMELGGFHKVSLEKTQELAHMYSAEYIAQRFGALDSARLSYLFDRNVLELKHLIRELWLELSVSEFAPDQFEIGFGDGLPMPAISIPNSAMEAQLGGFVDRVDKWTDGENNYFRVVDYKSGKKSFDYCDVFNGMGLQMLLYMFALEQEGEAVLGKQPIPVGVQYFSARFPYLSEDRCLSVDEVEAERGKSLVRKGLVLADEKVLAAMEPEGAPQRLPVSRNKSGDLCGDIASAKQLSMLKTYVFKLLAKLVDDIASGDVTPNPYTRGESHNACRFCPYGAICHKSTVEGRRNYQAMKAQRFWDEVEKEVHGHG